MDGGMKVSGDEGPGATSVNGPSSISNEVRRSEGNRA
jgi:hypothetical protein